MSITTEKKKESCMESSLVTGSDARTAQPKGCLWVVRKEASRKQTAASPSDTWTAESSGRRAGTMVTVLPTHPQTPAITALPHTCLDCLGLRARDEQFQVGADGIVRQMFSEKRWLSKLQRDLRCKHERNHLVL